MDSGKASGVEALRKARFGAALGLSAAAVGMVALWGFTVDDALITARVAHQLATGVGCRMNPGGPPVDAVTPLGFAHVLAPFASGGPIGAFFAARILGSLAWLGAATWLGASIGALGGAKTRFVPLVVVALSAPLGAWASSGMETGIVTLLATLAISRSRWAPLAAGLAAAWRPELLPWAMALAIGGAFVRTSRPGPALFALLLAIAPAAAVAIARSIAFGSPMPLAALAKPSSLDDGLLYSARALIFTGFPWLLLSPALRRLERHALLVLVACFVHFGSLALAGGDWMPLFRLAVPILPGLIWVAALLYRERPSAGGWLRLGLALAACVWIWVGTGFAARHIVTQRLAAIEAARAPLSGAKHVATLDAGWVGIATAAEIVDVAGVTDPQVARLAGGHTSKVLPDDFFDRREVDAVLVLVDRRLPEPGYFRVDDRRLAIRAEERGFTKRATIGLAQSSFEYVILRR